MNLITPITPTQWHEPHYTASLPKKRELRYFPFSEFAVSASADTIKQTRLAQHSSWIFPQLLAHIGQMRLYKTDSGHYHPLAFLDRNLGSDPQLQGMWRVMTRVKRSELIKPQNTPQNAQYSALVPLILAAVRQYQGVPYSSWSRDGLGSICETNLAEAMLVEPESVPKLDVTEILELRLLGLTTSTTGVVANPVSKYALTGLGTTALGHLPTYAKTMICQTWVAHPTLRTQYMVLDPVNWDTVPQPLITQEVVPAKWTAAHQKWY